MAFALLAIALAVSVAGAAPMLVWSPLILGVPHVLADFWCLLLRPARPLRAGLLWAAVPLAALALHAVLVAAGRAAPAPRADLLLGLSAVLAGVLAAERRAPPWLAAVLLAAFAAILLRPRAFTLSLAYAHNFVAVAFWLWLAGVPRPRAAAALFAAACAALALGLFEPAARAFDGSGFAALAADLAPGAAPELAARAARLFTFAQAVHYAAWLWLIPAALIARRADTRPPLALILVGLAGAAALLCAGRLEPAAARGTYLAVAGFHAWLELAVAAHLLLAGSGGNGLEPA